jgi:hypothetical protein
MFAIPTERVPLATSELNPLFVFFLTDLDCSSYLYPNPQSMSSLKQPLASCDRNKRRIGRPARALRNTYCCSGESLIGVCPK